MSLQVIQIINICITVNVFVIAVILLIRKTGNPKANRLLGIILLSNVIINVWNILLKTDFYQYVVYWDYIAGFAAGPTIYLYVQENIGKKTSFNFKTAAQYLLMPVGVVFFLIYCFKSPAEKQVFMQQVHSFQNLEYQLFDVLFYLQFTFYLIFGLVIVYKNKKVKKEFYSSDDKIKLDWLFAFLFTLLLMDLAAIPIATFGMPTMIQFVPILSSLIYLTVVYKAFTHPIIFFDYRDFRESISKEDTLKEIPVTSKAAIPNTMIQKIESYMENNKPYLNKELTIRMLSEELQMPSHQLSHIINQYFKKNFYDFINGYRIEHAKKTLLDPAFLHLKIESIGEAAGFNSRASFFSIFKKHTGITPSEFRKKSSPNIPV